MVPVPKALPVYTGSPSWALASPLLPQAAFQSPALLALTLPAALPEQ